MIHLSSQKNYVRFHTSDKLRFQGHSCESSMLFFNERSLEITRQSFLAKSVIFLF